MKRLLITTPFAILLATSPALADNQWIIDHHLGSTVTGGLGDLDPTHNSWKFTAPVFFRDAECKGGYYCLQVFTPRKVTSAGTSAYFMNVKIHDQGVNGQYAAGFLTTPTGPSKDYNDDPPFDVYMSNVTITPNLPAWKDYQTTNFDGITFDGGWRTGHVYAEDLTVNNWADAAIDVKGKQVQLVRFKSGGDGTNNGHGTLKLWWAGPHYIVDSTVNNSTFLTAGASGDSGLVGTYDCATLELRIWNSTFNGSTTLPRSKIACWGKGTSADVKVTYLTTDPRTTGEMHPMFGSAPGPAPSPDPAPAPKLVTTTTITTCDATTNACTSTTTLGP